MIKCTAESGARHARHSAAAICLGVALAALATVGCGHKGADAHDASNPPPSTDSSTSTGGTSTSGSTGDMGTGGTNMNGTGTATGGTSGTGNGGSASQ